MSQYLRELSFGEIVRACFEIYRHHFLTIFVIYFLPVFPLALMQNIAMQEEELAVFFFFLILGMVFISLAYAALAVTLSDVCLGNKPGFFRSYRYVFGSILGKLIATNLLQILAIFVGFILLIIPGIFITVWLVFVPIIVILENIWGRDALKRSKNLGKGFHMRTFGLFVVFFIIFFVIGAIVGGFMGIMNLDQMTFDIVILIMQTLLQPLILIMIILSYYDLRVRKEAYDAATLAEELHR